jgi:hypothetical protein
MDILMLSALEIILAVALIVLTIYLLKSLIAMWKIRWKSGAVPSKEEINNERVIDLANMLQGKTDKETLTNILEWEQRNMHFWIERHPTPLLLNAVIGCLFASIILTLSYSDIQGIGRLFIAGLIAMLVTIVAMSLLNISYGKRLPLSKFLDAIRPSISIENIIVHRLGVCRDYAKLTACLLSRLYPNTDIYYAHTSDHVAVGIVT